MKRLDEFVTNSPEEIAKQVEFFQCVEVAMPNHFAYYNASQNDLDVLMRCLNVYQNTGINYFPRYMAFANTVRFSHFEKGIKGFSNEIISLRYTLDMFKEDINHLIEDMEFFNFPKVNGLCKEDYQDLLINCEKEYEEIIKEYERTRLKEKEDKLNELVEEYFNFDKFDMKIIEQHFEQCITSITEKRYTLDQLSTNMQPTEPNKVYLVVMFSGNTVVRVGKTRQVILWAMRNIQEYDHVEFGLYLVDEEYVDELRVKVCLYLNPIHFSNAMVEVSNKMYANLNQAKKVYSHLYEITFPRLKKIMSLSSVAQRQLGNIKVVEKAELDQHVRRYLKLNANKKNL